jgi:glycerol-3-phosphate acyltransferase PlsY
MPDVQMPILYWPLLLLGAYLLGSIPFAQVLARLKGVDLREAGTGNVGAGNLTREVGLAWGIVAAVLDGLKGLIPVWIARQAGLGLGAAGLAGLAAVVGHNWSIWLRGRSGRGLAPSVGVLLALDPVLMVWTTGWAVAGWKIGGGLGGFLGWGLLPIVAVSLGRPATESLFLALLAVVLIGRRMQGNHGDQRGLEHAFERAIYDKDRAPVEDYPEGAEDPLTS